MLIEEDLVRGTLHVQCDSNAQTITVFAQYVNLVRVYNMCKFSSFIDSDFLALSQIRRRLNLNVVKKVHKI